VAENPGPDFVTIETPEHVTFHYEIAGLLSRSLAALIDHVIQLIALFVLFLGIVVAIVGAQLSAVPDLSLGLMAALMVLSWLIIFAYFVAFEILWRGQTPGKRLVGIRVIRDGGYGVTPAAILARNLVRFFGDMTPLPGAGLGFMFASRQSKRLGDHVAGTIVVRDVPSEPPPANADRIRFTPDENLINDLRRAGIHRLRPDYVKAIESFLVRCHALEDAPRAEIAWRLADPIARTMLMPMPDPERLLRHVAAALRETVERKELRFVRDGKSSWQKLDTLVSRLGRLAPAELLELVAVYRRTTGDLARARTLRARADIVDYLNGLIGRIHFKIYTTPGFSGWRFVRFFTHVLPQTVRRNTAMVVAATLLTVLPALAAYLAVGADPTLTRVFLPPDAIRQIDAYGKLDARGAGEISVYTSFYIVNNVTVSFRAFAVGSVTLGLGSFYILSFNGALLGAMLAAVGQAGATRPFLSFVSTHGGIEIFAIILAGAAGLRLGVSLINPGEHTRGRAFLEAGRDAGIIMFGVAAMLLIAAVLEAAVSPAPFIPDVVKWILGVINLAWILAYYALAGRTAKNA